MGALSIKRAYEPPDQSDGRRILVDRLWPRGLSLERAAIDDWMKDIAPSSALRKWFAHDPARFAEFTRRYREELDANPEAVERLRAALRHGDATLIYSARDEVNNQARVLLDYIAGVKPG